MATMIITYLRNLWPVSLLSFDDIRESDKLVKKLHIPKSTKQFVYAFQEPNSQSVIYILCVQNLSEQSVVDAECLIREIKPDAVVAQLGHYPENQEFTDGNCVEHLVPTSSIEVVRRCFVDKVNKERYESVAGSVVLGEIFGVGFNGHFMAAKKAAAEVGSAFFLLESPFVKCSTDENGSGVGERGSGNRVQGLGLETCSLVPQTAGSMVSLRSRVFCVMDGIQSGMVRSLSSYFVNSMSVSEVGGVDIKPQIDYEAPKFAELVYPLLVDLHDIFVDIPAMGRALAFAQKMFHDVNKGEAVDTQLLSEVYAFRIAVEGLRIALTNVGKLPIGEIGNPVSSETAFSELPVEDKSHTLLAQALKSQMNKFRSIVAVVDASNLAGLRKNWKTPVPPEVEEMVEELVTSCENIGEVSRYRDKKGLLTGKQVVAVGAGATAVLGVSSLSKAAPASTLVKVVTFKVPASIKLMMTQTQKAIALAVGKTVGPTKVVVPGVKTSVLNATASAEKIRSVAHGVIASVEKTSLSAMRTAFYEIMRTRSRRPTGLLPWATFGFSVATCASLLVYGDGIECAAESLPAAPSIASLGRGIRSLHEASQAVKQTESSRVKKSMESLLCRFKKIKVQ